MISDDLKVEGEFYVALIYNYFITHNKTLGYDNVGTVGHGMH